MINIHFTEISVFTLYRKADTEAEVFRRVKKSVTADIQLERLNVKGLPNVIDYGGGGEGVRLQIKFKQSNK